MFKEIFVTLWQRKDFFFTLTIEHLAISALAILIAVILGGLAGILISEYKRTSKMTLAAINFLYTIPSISMLGFLIPFSGIGNATAVIALTIYALLPMVRNTHTGIVNIDERIIEAGVGMGSTRLQVLTKIKIPLAVPVIFSGIRNMVTMTIALAGIASFIGAGGLGVAIYRGITTNNIALTVAGSLLIALLALITDWILGLVEQKMAKRRKTASRRLQGRRMAVVGALVLVLLISSTLIGTKLNEKTLHIATKPMTEQYIIGEMLDIIIEEQTDITVKLTQGVGGGTSNIHPGMEAGEFDLYPEYTGTGWNIVLKNTSLYNEDLFEQLQSAYKDKYDMQWVGMYGFNNTYGIAVRRDVAQKYHLKTYSDLKNVAGMLIYGAEYDFFEREDGYAALCDAYDLQFKSTVDLDIGLKYQAINEGKIDLMTIFTTDGQLSAADLVVLVDDKGFYPSYRCGNVVRTEVLEAHPELVAVLLKLENKIDDAAMAKMNYEVEQEGKEPEEVARAFLLQHNLINDKGGAKQ